MINPTVTEDNASWVERFAGENGSHFAALRSVQMVFPVDLLKDV